MVSYGTGTGTGTGCLVLLKLIGTNFYYTFGAGTPAGQKWPVNWTLCEPLQPPISVTIC
jgi:hypothetical protein